MARGNSNSTDGLKLFFMNIRGLKAGETVRIEQQESKDGKYVKLEETVNEVSGKFVEARIRKYEIKGEEAHELKITLKDVLNGEMYVIGCGINSIGRSIMNSLLGLEKPEELSIGVYMNKNGYPAVSVKNNSERADWKYDLAFQNTLIVENTVREKGKTVVRKDYYELDKFLMEEITKKFKVAEKPEKKQQYDEPTPNGPSDDDDLPF
jgi:hypothetical protein